MCGLSPRPHVPQQKKDQYSSAFWQPPRLIACANHGHNVQTFIKCRPNTRPRWQRGCLLSFLHTEPCIVLPLLRLNGVLLSQCFPAPLYAHYFALGHCGCCAMVRFAASIAHFGSACILLNRTAFACCGVCIQCFLQHYQRLLTASRCYAATKMCCCCCHIMAQPCRAPHLVSLP